MAGSKAYPKVTMTIIGVRPERSSGRRLRVNRIGAIRLTAISWEMRSSLTDRSSKSTCSMIPALFINTSTLP